jgi:hypothetical protein
MHLLHKTADSFTPGHIESPDVPNRSHNPSAKSTGASLVSVDLLASLDHLQWLRTGLRAGEALNSSQSKICRSVKRCEAILGIRLTKVDSEWITAGDTDLLAAERHVHQHYRWSKGRPLRLDGNHSLLYERDALRQLGWTCGSLDNTCHERLSQLLEQRVIDAWMIGGNADQIDRSTFHAYELQPGVTLMIKPQFVTHPRIEALLEKLALKLGAHAEAVRA